MSDLTTRCGAWAGVLAASVATVYFAAYCTWFDKPHCMYLAGGCVLNLVGAFVLAVMPYGTDKPRAAPSKESK